MLVSKQRRQLVKQVGVQDQPKKNQAATRKPPYGRMLAAYKSSITELTQAIARGLSHLELVTPDDPPDTVNSVVAKLNADLKSAKQELTKFKLFTTNIQRGHEQEQKQDQTQEQKQEHQEAAKLSFVALQQLVSLQERQIKSAEHKFNLNALSGGKFSEARAVTVGFQIDEQNKTLDRSASRLKGVKQTLAEVGNSTVVITDELERNRQTLRKAKQTTGQTHTELKGAGRILSRMFVRNVAQRAAIFGIIFAGVAVIVLTLAACLATPPNPNLIGVATTGAPLSTSQHLRN